jgi:NADH-quinone oxidoreductase subunit M
MYNKVFMGPVDKPENEELEDISWAGNWTELAALIPILIMVFVIGLYPRPFFELMDASVGEITQFLDATVVANR